MQTYLLDANHAFSCPPGGVWRGGKLQLRIFKIFQVISPTNQNLETLTSNHNSSLLSFALYNESWMFRRFISAVGFQAEHTSHLDVMQGTAKHLIFKQLGILVSYWYHYVLNAHSHPESQSLIQAPKWEKLSEASDAVWHAPFLLFPISWTSAG